MAGEALVVSALVNCADGVADSECILGVVTPVVDYATGGRCNSGVVAVVLGDCAKAVRGDDSGGEIEGRVRVSPLNAV